MKLSEKLRNRLFTLTGNDETILAFQFGTNWYKILTSPFTDGLINCHLPIEFMFRAETIINLTTGKYLKFRHGPLETSISTQDLFNLIQLPPSSKEDIAQREKITLFSWRLPAHN